MAARADPGQRWVDCPYCRQPALYGPANPSRPFCSARCRSLDLGAWASEDYRVASTQPGADDDSAGAEPPAH